MKEFLKKEWVVVSFLFFLPFVFFYKIIFFGYVIFGGDFSFQFLPQRIYVANQIRDGILPLWSHDLLTGVPIFALADNAVLYPLNLLLLFFPNYLGFHYLTIISLSLGAVFMYIFLKSLNLNKLTIILGSSFYIFFLLPLSLCITDLNVVIYLPLMFYFVEILSRKDKPIYIFLGGVIISLQILAGNPQISFGNMLAVIVFVVFKAFQTNANKISFLKKVILMIFFGTFLSCVQIIPTYELTTLSYRATHHTYEDMIGRSLSPLTILFISCILSPFVVISFLFYKNKYNKIFLALIVLLFFLALGKYNPLNKLLFYLPGIKLFRDVHRFVYVSVFPSVMFFVFSVDVLLNLKIKNKIFDICRTGGILITFCLLVLLNPVNTLTKYKPYKKNLKDFLQMENITYISVFTDSSIYREKPDFVKFLQKQKGIFKVVNINEPKTPFVNFLLFYNIPSLFGKTTLPPSQIEEYLLKNIYFGKGNIDILNVKYLLFPEPVFMLDETVKLVFDGEFKIYENKNYFPKIFVVPNLEYDTIGDKMFLQDKLKIIQYSPNRIKATVKLSQEGYLVFNNTNYPGWKAKVNGKKKRIQNFSLFLNAFEVAKGTSNIELFYDPLSFKVGFLISLLFVGVIMVYEIFYFIVLRKYEKYIPILSKH